MRILYLHQYFKTPEEGGAIRSYYLAKGLVAAGHEVEMITSHNAPEYKVEMIEGIRVHYLPIYYHNKLSFLKRGIAFLNFVIDAYKLAISISGIDLCFATSTPLSVGWIALKLKKQKGIPYIFEVRDLWPEAPVQLEVIKSPILKSLLYSIEKKIYEQAKSIIALSPGMQKGVLSKAPHKKVSIISNMADCEFFKPEEKQAELIAKYDVSNRFVLTYIGAIGKVNKLDFLIKIAAYCQKNIPQVQVLIAGDGGELQTIKETIKSLSLSNIRHVGFFNKGEVAELLNITDACYISFDQKPILETNSPNKFFDTLAAGRLSIVNNKGWIKDLIEENACGFYADPLNPETFGEKILTYINNPELLVAAQHNARKLAENSFSREKLTAKFVQFIEE